MNDKHKTGAAGEEQALEFLQKEGFEKVALNFRAGRGEIDLIVKKENVLHFVEVKTRKNNTFGEPEDFVSDRQADKIRTTAELFLESIDWNGFIQFDIVAVLMKNEVALEILHLEDAF